jgi:hypothetical protein
MQRERRRASISTSVNPAARTPARLLERSPFSKRNIVKVIITSREPRRNPCSKQPRLVRIAGEQGDRTARRLHHQRHASPDRPFAHGFAIATRCRTLGVTNASRNFSGNRAH